jgi:hypothetical protein
MEYQAKAKTSQSKQDVEEMSKSISWKKVLENLMFAVGDRVNSADDQSI